MSDWGGRRDRGGPEATRGKEIIIDFLLRKNKWTKDEKLSLWLSVDVPDIVVVVVDVVLTKFLAPGVGNGLENLPSSSWTIHQGVEKWKRLARDETEAETKVTGGEGEKLVDDNDVGDFNDGNEAEDDVDSDVDDGNHDDAVDDDDGDDDDDW